MAILNFNARQVEPSAGFDPLPAGWYNAKMIESEIKPTRAGDGSMLSVQFEIIDGQYANRRIFNNYNLENKNPVAVKIAFEQLSAFAWCVGVPDLQDSTMAHGIPLQIKLKVREAANGYDASNDISDYRNIHGQSAKEIIAAQGGGAGAPAAGSQAPAAPGAPAAPQAPAAPAAPGAPAAVAHDPMAAAVADGWIKHPSAPGYHYRGTEVLGDDAVAMMYPAVAAAPPAAPPAPPAAPAAPAAPAVAGGATPPWAAPKA